MPHRPGSADDPLAELADLVLNVGRLVRARTPTGPDVVALTETERFVMRVVDLFPGASPSLIARHTRLQRTNVSAALRGLEEKGMVSRVASDGRSVAVHPTERAASNLGVLRAAWSSELAGVLGEDLDEVRRCAELLARIERHLTAAGPGEQG
ncbi:MarR family winged helix-turn-helix transcriptional regulator [Actinosynnema pretiosum]|uniref:MarR family transcriptional regulator n=1 Tax=Actinosynnema pretiosum TaxID=42197 RepID=A0A290Z9D9_9PSEU|nr:MarR family transcriptional regulator [Actinosynnema pretiosum]ATE55593.1 MarR family transcriptional regulator [Actinosynnema pretiosum]